MSFNSSGTFTINTAGQPVVQDTTIDPSVFNALTADLATGLTSCAIRYAEWAGTAGGTANALTLTPATAITAYSSGQAFTFKAGAASNTGAATVAISGLTTKAIQNQGSALTGGMIRANYYYRIFYDGAAFQLSPIEVLMSPRDMAPTSIVNTWSSGGGTPVGISAGRYTPLYAKNTLSGALNAGVYSQIVSVTGSGVVDVIAVKREDGTSRTIGCKVVVDGNTVFDASDATTASAGAGFWVVNNGTFYNDAGTTPFSAPQNQSFCFYSSLVISVKSSLTETDKVSLYTQYRQTS